MAERAFGFDFKSAEERKGSGTLDFGYWAYRIQIQTTLPMYTRKEMEVVRRYSDFEWFRAQLCEMYPFFIIPPIPEKDVQSTLNKLVGGPSNGPPRLVEYRQRALKRFLVRVGAHPHLQTAQLLQNFLEMSEEEWEHRMRAATRPGDRSLASSIGESVNHALALQWSGAAGLARAGESYAKALAGRADPRVWEETRVYVQQLEDSLRMLRERVQGLVERRRQTGNALHAFGVAFERVGAVEGRAHGLALSPAMVAVGQHSAQLSAIYDDFASEETKQVVETLSYYAGLCLAVRETLRRVQQMAAQLDALRQHEADAAAQLERANAKGGQAERVTRLTGEIHAVKERQEAALRELIAAEGVFKEELCRFHREKQYDVKGLLKTFAELQLGYATRMREKWQGLIPTVEKVRIEEEGRTRQPAAS